MGGITSGEEVTSHEAAGDDRQPKVRRPSKSEPTG